MTDAVVVLGAGGHGKVVADAANASGLRVLGFADDDPAKLGTEVGDATVVATGMSNLEDFCSRHQATVALGIGDNRSRKRAFERLVSRGLTPATVVHPAATISDSATLGAGTVVFAAVVVNPDSRIGDNVILNTSCSIDHDNTIGSHAHVSPGARLGGTVEVGEGSHIGIGACVRNDLRIGAWTTVGAGAAVVDNLPDRIVAYGVPARVAREAQSD